MAPPLLIFPNLRALLDGRSLGWRQMPHDLRLRQFAFNGNGNGPPSHFPRVGFTAIPGTLTIETLSVVPELRSGGGGVPKTLTKPPLRAKSTHQPSTASCLLGAGPGFQLRPQAPGVRRQRVPEDSESADFLGGGIGTEDPPGCEGRCPKVSMPKAPGAKRQWMGSRQGCTSCWRLYPGGGDTGPVPGSQEPWSLYSRGGGTEFRTSQNSGKKSRIFPEFCANRYAYVHAILKPFVRKSPPDVCHALSPPVCQKLLGFN